MDTRPPAVHCTLCVAAGAHEAYWRDALDHYARNPVQTAAGSLVEPSVPWLAVEMLPGSVEYTPDDLMMLADAEEVHRVGADGRVKPGPKPKPDSLTDAPVIAVKVSRADLRAFDPTAKARGLKRSEAIREALRRYAVGDADG